MSAHAGGMCMSQCKHWRIPLFLFRRAKKKCMRILSWETSEEAFFLLKIGPASLGSDFVFFGGIRPSPYLCQYTTARPIFQSSGSKVYGLFRKGSVFIMVLS